VNRCESKSYEFELLTSKRRIENSHHVVCLPVHRRRLRLPLTIEWITAGDVLSSPLGRGLADGLLRLSRPSSGSHQRNLQIRHLASISSLRPASRRGRRFRKHHLGRRYSSNGTVFRPCAHPNHRSPLNSRQNSPAAVERSRLTTNSSDGNRPKSADKRTKSPLGSNTSSASRRDDAYANKWHQPRTERSQYSSTDTEDEDFQKAVQKIQDLRRKKLEEQYEVAIRTLTPVIREHVKKIKSASPEKVAKKTAAAAEGTTSTQISKRKKANSESEKKSSLDHAFDVT